ncbi:NEK protein kinase [Thecamonas trahens ATCC 50062]|uniref:non-specific serine/threonine protein kinase n=1 Tax=Thecamonas trahens ATCC 50062 TaxID=461836 RepID=A0A0L0DPE3_THETB|nr:NEK protein kinase [Thecamonas trahens ATCC 50062]KNC53293.1 NEK protein kinase [Thecamonas trahens ATCC 50062]|eukprot:XP_013754555.1 NEK protein kinase [Thecamonas trahens ATCC 50062]
MNEVSALLALSHPYIIALEESFVDKRTLCIVMEFAEGGELGAAVVARRRAGMDYYSEDEVLNLFTQLALALKHVHDKKIIHRDLKSENVFLAKDGTIRLGDFGLTGLMTAQVASMDLACGTPFYMAPEVFTSEYNSKADVWSLGCILYELCSLYRPFSGEGDSDSESDDDDYDSEASWQSSYDDEEVDGGVYGPAFRSVVRRVLSGKVPRLPRGQYSPQLEAFYDSIMKHAPDQRPSVTTLLNHPIIKPRVKSLLTRTQYLEEFSRNSARRKLRDSWLQIDDLPDTFEVPPEPASVLRDVSSDNLVVASPREVHPYAAALSESLASSGSGSLALMLEEARAASVDTPALAQAGGSGKPTRSLLSDALKAEAEVAQAEACSPPTADALCGSSAQADTRPGTSLSSESSMAESPCKTQADGRIPKLRVAVTVLDKVLSGWLHKFNGVSWKKLFYELHEAHARLYWWRSQEAWRRGPEAAFGSMRLSGSVRVYRLRPDDVPPAASAAASGAGLDDAALDAALEIHVETARSSSSALLVAESGDVADAWVDGITKFHNAFRSQIARPGQDGMLSGTPGSGTAGSGSASGVSPRLKERAFDVLAERYARMVRSSSDVGVFSPSSASAGVVPELRSIGERRTGSRRGRAKTELTDEDRAFVLAQAPPVVMRRMRTASFQKLLIEGSDE